MKRATVGAIQSTVTGVFIVSGRTLQPKKKMGKPTYEALSKVCSCVSSLTTFQPGDTSMKISPERIWLKLFRKRRISVSPADKANRWEVYTSFTPAICQHVT